MTFQQLLNMKQFKQALQVAERTTYTRAYECAMFNQVGTAKLLGVSRGTLRSKLKSFKLI